MRGMGLHPESEPELAHVVNGRAPRAFVEALAETRGRCCR